ncbi:phage tail terminator protein [Methylovulum psychrotolerans]|uniref:Uncharacterized protein n=1 Tax=Methylovulum psychrotolerans TaxID=1704499 RepID=A0A2S5CGG2_9GAMM|nr:hypothetical protein [Methylovulum psychrotolerans]POZ49901.1 hypothetical protein AADEFJLK_04347 [Methylovulum psychrotolerans]
MIHLPDLVDWADCLTENCPTFGGRFYQVIPDDSLMIDDRESPVGFVYLSGDAAETNSIATGVRQRVAMEVTVEVIQRRTASKTDKFSSVDADQQRIYRLEIQAALVGWKPVNCLIPIERVSGEQGKKDLRQLTYKDTFRTDYMIFK